MIALDTNIILELLEKRQRYDKIISYLTKNSNETIAISTLTISNVFYLIGNNLNNIKTAKKLIKSFQIISVNEFDAQWAFDNFCNKDYEDALQVASAIRNKCTVFVTIDKQLAKKYQKHLSVYLIS